MSPRRVVLLWLSVAAVALTWLALELPAEGFFSGDPGVKLIAAFDALEHPNRPLDIDLPNVAGHPQAVYLERFFQLHGDHAHALQSPFFPLLSAPFIAVLGIRGAYLIPGVCFLAMVPLLALLRRQLSLSAPVWLTCFFALVVSPIFFYSLEFWEHVPAIGALTAATTTAFSSAIIPLPLHPIKVWRGVRLQADLSPSADRQQAAQVGVDILMAASGALTALAIQLRPEAFWYAAGLAAALVHRRISRAQWTSFFTGAAAGLLPFVIFNYLHSGSVTGPHVSANLAPLREDYWQLRAHRLSLWLIPSSVVGIIGAGMVAGAWIGHAITRVSDRIQHRAAPLSRPINHLEQPGGVVPHHSIRSTSWRYDVWPMLALAGGMLVAISAATGGLVRDSLWTAWPVGVLALAPASMKSVSGGARALYWIAAISVAGVLLTAAHDGGAQWGPRFLLIAAPALILIAAEHSAALWKEHRRRQRFVLGLLIVILICGVAATRRAYRELRGAKRYYARIVEATDRLVPAGHYVVTDLWWFDQITAALYRRLTVLHVDGSAEASMASETLRSLGVRSFVLVTSRSESELDGAQLTGCQVTESHDVPERELTFADVSCR